VDEAPASATPKRSTSRRAEAGRHQAIYHRWPANGTVARRQFLPQPLEFDKPVDRAQEVPLWHMIFERELVKQSVLPETAFPLRLLHPGPNDRSEAAAPNRRNPGLFQRHRPRKDV